MALNIIDDLSIVAEITSLFTVVLSPVLNRGQDKNRPFYERGMCEFLCVC